MGPHMTELTPSGGKAKTWKVGLEGNELYKNSGSRDTDRRGWGHDQPKG